MSSSSVTFDRAAEYYDRTRSNPLSIQRRVTELLTAELRPRQPVLEIGVGTGRVALPVHESGVRLVGADLSRPMMERLVAKAGGSPPFSLVQADATRLPFPDARSGPPWRPTCSISSPTGAARWPSWCGWFGQAGPC